MVQSLNSLDKKTTRALRGASVGVLLGWGILHLFWDAPYRTLLWSESLMSGVVTNLTSMSWSDYVTSPKMDLTIQWGIRALGVILVVAAGVALYLKERRPLARIAFLASAILLTVSFLNFLDTGSRVGMFIESAAQISAPVLLWFSLTPSGRDERLLLFIKIAVGLTFFGHGLYAVGFYPVPGNFIDMTINILGVSESTARILLKIAGFMDILIPIGLFSKRLSPAVFLYAAVWGALTTLARPVSFVLLGGGASGISFYLAQTLIRVPHFALPIAGLFLVRKSARDPRR
jgi:hypothetical protein